MLRTSPRAQPLPSSSPRWISSELRHLSAAGSRGSAGARGSSPPVASNCGAADLVHHECEHRRQRLEDVRAVAGVSAPACPSIAAPNTSPPNAPPRFTSASTATYAARAGSTSASMRTTTRSRSFTRVTPRFPRASPTPARRDVSKRTPGALRFTVELRVRSSRGVRRASRRAREASARPRASRTDLKKYSPRALVERRRARRSRGRARGDDRGSRVRAKRTDVSSRRGDEETAVVMGACASRAVAFSAGGGSVSRLCGVLGATEGTLRGSEASGDPRPARVEIAW